MFNLSPRNTKGDADPLRARKSAEEWFRALPALDVIGRQEIVIRAFGALRHTHVEYDVDRVAAMLFLDSALTADHQRVLKWYLDDLRGSAQLADRFWCLARDVNDGFAFAYDAAHRHALGEIADRRWHMLFARLTARLIHHLGVDAKLHLFLGERTIPAKWSKLHRLFLRACDQGCEREASPLPGEDVLATYYSIEQEYVHALLIDQFHTGNLTPSELDWASNKVRIWSRELKLLATPPAVDGFYVDLASGTGLLRRNGHAHGSKVGYLDTTPLVIEIERAIAALRAPDHDGAGNGDLQRQRRIQILEKIRPAILPHRAADLRRHPRVATDLAADVRVGLARIAHDLLEPEPGETLSALTAETTDAASEPARARDSERAHQVPSDSPGAHPPRELPRPAFASSANARAAPGTRRVAAPFDVAALSPGDTEEIEIHALAEDPTPTTWPNTSPMSSPTRSPPTSPMAAASPTPTQWRICDRSAAGWRISAPNGTGEGLALGTLVAVRPSNAGDWMLGVVSRLARRGPHALDAGMSMLATRVVPVTLHGRRNVQADMCFEVDGVDASTLGARFDGLYLIQPSRDDTRPVLRTLVIPRSEHFEGRRVILATPRSNYVVTLGPVIEQRADWSWVKITVEAKAARVA